MLAVLPNPAEITVLLIKMNTKSSPGFTLVELLVAITIMSLLMTFGIASYNNFARSQTLRNAALELKTNLRFAQNQALAGVKDSSCGTNELVGWYMHFTVSSSSYNLNIKCQDTTAYVRQTYHLSSGITVKSISAGRDVLFKPLVGVIFTDNANANVPTPLPGVSSVDIDLSSGSMEDRVTVTSQGEIHEIKL